MREQEPKKKMTNKDLYYHKINLIAGMTHDIYNNLMLIETCLEELKGMAMYIDDRKNIKINEEN